MLQPYIESATALSDYIDNEEGPQEFPFFLSGGRNGLPTLSWTHVSVDFKYDVLCL